MTFPAPDRRDRLVWFDADWWVCACGLAWPDMNGGEDRALHHAARCPTVIARRNRVLASS